MQLRHILRLVLVLALWIPSVWAGPGRSGDQGQSARQGGQVTPGQAEQIARRQTGGRVLAVKPKGGGYKVKVLTPAGEVRSVFVPGR